MVFPLWFLYYKMKIHRRMMGLLFLVVLVSGYNENLTSTATVSVHEDQLYNSSGKLEAKEEVNEEKKGLKQHYSYEAYFANKRRVPKASDPLHNR